MSFRMRSISSTTMERHASNAANNLNLEYTPMLKIIYIWCYIKKYSTQCICHNVYKSFHCHFRSTLYSMILYHCFVFSLSV